MPKNDCTGTGWVLTIDQAGRKKRYFTLGRMMNILITRLFDPLAEKLDENKGYRRHKSEMFRQSSNLWICGGKTEALTGSVNN